MTTMTQTKQHYAVTLLFWGMTVIYTVVYAAGVGPALLLTSTLHCHI